MHSYFENESFKSYFYIWLTENPPHFVFKTYKVIKTLLFYANVTPFSGFLFLILVLIKNLTQTFA